MGLLILYIFIIKNLVNNFRLEPEGLSKTREHFYTENFHKFTQKLDFKESQDKGFYCISKNNIFKNEEVMRLHKHYSYSVFENFPLKIKLYNLLSEENLIMKHPNMTSNIMLTMRLLFDIKANITDVYYNMKKFNDTEPSYRLDDFKQYLSMRNEMIFKYINNLPLASYLGESSWSEEDIEEYSLTGFLPVTKKHIVKLYESIVDSVSKHPILSKFAQSWLHYNNKNIFMGLYGYVQSRSFKVNNPNEKDRLFKEGSMLIPFIDLCNHYHPIEEGSNELFKIRPLKIIQEEDHIKILSLADYEKGEEFSFTYSTVLNNDYLLLNYGFIITNNPFQEFVFKFDISDPNFEFFRKLQENNFDTNLLRVIDNDKLEIHFSLLRGKPSDLLYQFIKIYLSYYEKSKQTRTIKKLMLYHNTIQRNVKNIFENSNFEEYYKSILEIIDKINGLEKEIKMVSVKTKENDLDNVLNFKALHDGLRKEVIKRFNLENIKILDSHKDIAIESSMAILAKELMALKTKY
jgi:hypothetical protein